MATPQNREISMKGKPVSTLILLFALLSLPLTAAAVDKIKVLALFPGKAMVEVDGTRRFLRQGQPSPEGVLLISATSKEAVIEVDGRQERYGLGSQFGGSFAKRQMAEVKIVRDASGAFITTGSINGRLTNMMVDTGATLIAMSEPEARRLGIQYRLHGERTAVRTASGTAAAYYVTLDRVQVGEIILRQVKAVVVDGTSPRTVLLGMSFLKRLEMENRGELLMLRRQF
ncbi:MAG: TIGR02281 family clan AA aspartic protease [Candidatus Sedimenticola sp. (ex Thyasira tokunagai)]